MDEVESRFPAMRYYTDLQRQHTTEDIAHIVDFLATALYVDDDGLFTRFITWTGEILEARGVSAHSLDPALESLKGQLVEFPRTQRLLNAALIALGRTATDMEPIA